MRPAHASAPPSLSFSGARLLSADVASACALHRIRPPDTLDVKQHERPPVRLVSTKPCGLLRAQRVCSLLALPCLRQPRVPASQEARWPADRSTARAQLALRETRPGRVACVALCLGLTRSRTRTSRWVSSRSASLSPGARGCRRAVAPTTLSHGRTARPPAARLVTLKTVMAATATTEKAAAPCSSALRALSARIAGRSRRYRGGLPHVRVHAPRV